MSAMMWAAFALVTGALLATQPIIVIAVAAFALLFTILSAMTPVAALMFLLVLAPLRTLVATEAAVQLPLDLGQFALLGFVASWVLHHAILEQTRPCLVWSRLFLPLFGLIVVFGITAFSAMSPGAWLSEWLKWVQILVVAALAITLADGRRWQWLVAGLLIAGVANALVGVYEFLGGSGALHLLINQRFFRAFGTFGQPNPFAGFLGLLVPVAMALILAYGLRWWRSRRTSDARYLAFYSMTALLLTTGIVISWSRGAWLGFAAAIITVVFAIPRRLIHGITMALAILSLVAGGWFAGLIPESIIARISSSTEEFFAFQDVRGIDITPENYPVAERLAHWQAAMNMATMHPWLGVGLGNYEIAYPQYRLINWDEPLGHAHNYYLNILAEAGVIGLLGYVKAWLVIMWLTWRLRSHPDILSRFVAIGLLGSWTYLAVHSLFDNLYVNNVFIHIGLMLGILGVLYNQISTHVKLRII